MASVWVDVDLEEVSTRDLLDEIEDRYLGTWEQKMLISMIRNEDRAKFDFFFQIKDKFTLSQLEELFKEPCINVPTPKEQLKLF